MLILREMLAMVTKNNNNNLIDKVETITQEILTKSYDISQSLKIKVEYLTKR